MDLNAKPGDVVVVDPQNLGQPRRRGEVLEVLGSGDTTHYRVRWDNGHESIFYPSSTARVVEPSQG